ncbi:MAG: hydrogenase formation protein HypD [Myxococcales bacterium]|nr:hydrogenase formation protein HypD [Myxococcales bacterium]
MSAAQVDRLQFRDPARARGLLDRLRALTAHRVDRPVTLMHVCGTHEQAIARFGLRSVLPPGLDLVMGPGCPVCVTSAAEIDAAVDLTRRGVRVATYGDMIRVPGTTLSLADAQTEGGRVELVYGVDQAVELARAEPETPMVFFATGFETTAVTTAAALLAGPPDNFFVYSAHKYVPPAMEVVAAMPDTRVEGFLAAGHAATITGFELFEPMAKAWGKPIVIMGFEPLDILAALVRAVELVVSGTPTVENLFPRCVTGPGNGRALDALWQVFELTRGHWRGIADLDAADLDLRAEFARWDARVRFDLPRQLGDGTAHAACPVCPPQQRCGDILVGNARPDDCPLFGKACTPDSPVGASMVSSEGMCRIWFQYGGRPELGP